MLKRIWYYELIPVSEDHSILVAELVIAIAILVLATA